MSSQAKTYEYTVKMTCDGCSGAVQRVLGKLEGKGIEKIDISLEQQSVKVTSSIFSADEVLEMIKKTGKAVEYIGST